mgnify:CR=1 FL=1
MNARLSLIIMVIMAVTFALCALLMIPQTATAQSHNTTLIKVVAKAGIWPDDNNALECGTASLTVVSEKDGRTLFTTEKEIRRPTIWNDTLKFFWERPKNNECYVTFEDVVLAKNTNNRVIVAFRAKAKEGGIDKWNLVVGSRVILIHVPEIIAPTIPFYNDSYKLPDTNLWRADGRRAIIVAKVLNVRSGPGINYSQLDTVFKGTELAVIGSGGGWWKVCCVGNGEKEGWISGGTQYVKVDNSYDPSLSTRPSGNSGLTPAVARTSTPVATRPDSTTPGNTSPTSNIITDFERWGTWRRGDEPYGSFTQAQEQKYGGRFSGKFTFDLPANRSNFVVYRPVPAIPIPGRPDGLRIWVYGNGSGVFLNVWLEDANGQRWQFGFGRILHVGWKQMTAPFNLVQGWPNGPVGEKQVSDTLTYPLSLFALVIDGVDDQTSAGTVYLDNLTAAHDTLAATPTVTAFSTQSIQPTLTLVPSPANAIISFRADRTSLSIGECTWLYWNVDNVREVYFNDEGVIGHDRRQVCPNSNADYSLRVVHSDGRSEMHSVSITVWPTATPTPVPPMEFTPVFAVASFLANTTSIIMGECVTLYWNVEGVREVYFGVYGYQMEPVTGGEARVRCPTETTTYGLRIIHIDGREEMLTITVTVNSSAFLVTPFPVDTPVPYPPPGNIPWGCGGFGQCAATSVP